MSAYHLGLSAGGVTLPEQATYALDRLGRITSGSRDVFRGGSRFYGRGVVGATTPGNLVTWTLDLLHVILLLGGAFLMWSAIVG